MAPIIVRSNITLAAPYVAGWAPIYPRDSVHGVRRHEPSGWLCPKGFKHATREVCVH